jgi:hypothetical protein
MNLWVMSFVLQLQQHVPHATSASAFSYKYFSGFYVLCIRIFQIFPVFLVVRKMTSSSVLVRNIYIMKSILKTPLASQVALCKFSTKCLFRVCSILSDDWMSLTFFNRYVSHILLLNSMKRWVKKAEAKSSRRNPSDIKNHKILHLREHI